MTEEFYCQSCGRKMVTPSEFGTHNDGSRNKEYCATCYDHGHYTEPDLTRWQMLSRLLPVWMEKNHLPYREALIETNFFLSGLDRWKRTQMWT